MAVCTRCGAEIPKGASFCTNCGQGIEKGSAPEEKQSSTESSIQKYEYKTITLAQKRAGVVFIERNSRARSNSESRSSPWMEIALPDDAVRCEG